MTTLLLGLNSFAGATRGIQRDILLIDYWFIIKGYNSGTDRLQSTEKEWGKGTELFKHHEPKVPSAHQPRSSPNLVLLGLFHFFFFNFVLKYS